MIDIPPFSCAYSPVVVDILRKYNCAVLLSSFQAGKLILISAKDGETVIQLPRTFEKPMGVAINGKKLVVATKDEVILMENSPQMAITYPKKPSYYDSLYLPRASFYTGNVDLHDLHLTNEGTIWAVNTSFSCVVKVNSNWSFEPIWKPRFIDHLASEDRCHLNGLVMENSKPKFVSALSNSNSPFGWKQNVTETGIVMEVESNEIIAQGLSIPHSPRIYDGSLYLLQSGKGELIKVDTQSGKFDVVAKLNGFARGMSRIGDYLFISISKIRKNSSSFGKLIDSKLSDNCGFVVVYLPTGNIVADLFYRNSVEEIYDLQIIENTSSPNILNTENPIYKRGLVTPENTYWANELIDDNVTPNK